jgi:CubicO group peptidase (beta-lactamase class C family)
MRLGYAALLVITVGAVHPARAQRRIPLARFDRPPSPDGTLSDAEWRRATRFTAFTTLHPQAGLAPSESTEAYLAYDDAHLYVGIRSFDRHADSIQASAVTTGDAWHGDWIAFCLDPQGQGLDALYFLVTPAGFKATGVLGFDGGPVQTTRHDWSSAVRAAPDGYTAVMAIPLAQLPYRSGDSVKMAFKLARRVGRSGEEMDFPGIDPDRPHIAQFLPIMLTGVVASTAPYGRPLFDPRGAYRDKVRRLARIGDSTMDERVEAWGDASVFDDLVFPARLLAPSVEPDPYPRHVESDAVTTRFARLDYLPGRPIGDLEVFLNRTQSTSLIVIHNDTIIYERYFNGWGPDSLFTSFSVAKAFDATLVGIAIDRGLIHAVSDPITRYIPELASRDTRFSHITIRDLLRMSSGLRYVEDEEPYDNRWTYLAPDLRRAALERSGIVEQPGTRWLYNNYNPLLIGMMLERVSHRTVTDLLQRWIWDPLGMQYGGSWSIDSRESGFEKMESGINARPVDFAKLGSLYLHDGVWNGRRVVSAAWVHEATQPWPDPPGYYADQGFFGPGGHYFGYFWWGDTRADGPSDFHTVGNKGQFIYCSPQKQLVIVRTGMEFGVSSATWLRLFHEFADQFREAQWPGRQ